MGIVYILYIQSGVNSFYATHCMIVLTVINAYYICCHF